MEKVAQLSEKIINETDAYSKQYTTNEGKTATTQQSLATLNTIIQDICVLYKYIVEKKLYEQMKNTIPALNSLSSLIQKIQINETNANKLHLDSALQVWQQIKAVGTLLACMVLDNIHAHEK